MTNEKTEETIDAEFTVKSTKVNPKEKIKNLFNKISEKIVPKNKWIRRFVTLTLVLLIVAVTIDYIEQIYSQHLINVKRAQLIAQDAKTSEMFRLEKQKDDISKMARSQIVSLPTDGIMVIYNLKENSFPLEYRNRITEWAKRQGYDGIVFGRIQPQFNGGVVYTSYSGRNEVPLEYVTERLRKAGCKNAISVMGNRSNFWLPYPFTYQIDGDLNFYKSKGINAAGLFKITNDKIIFEAKNFKGVLKDGKLSVALSDKKPWRQFEEESSK